MSRSAIALGALVLALAGGAVGYWRGQADGRATTVARQDAQTVKSLTDTLAAHSDLVKKTSEASRRLRQATAQRQVVDTTTTEEMRNALALTTDSRAGCVLPAGVVQQLGAARERAAQAAAGGIVGPVPATSGER